MRYDLTLSAHGYDISAALELPAGAPAGGGFGAGALASMPPEAIEYMRDCDATDPAATIATYDKPVLLIQGGADTSVPPPSTTSSAHCNSHVA